MDSRETKRTVPVPSVGADGEQRTLPEADRARLIAGIAVESEEDRKSVV